MRWVAFLILFSLSIATRAETVEFVHTDPLGSPVTISNQVGQVIQRMQYEPYGAIIGQSNGDRTGYTGHVMDGATGLTYMQQRYFDPLIGTFLSVDPVSADAKIGRNFNRYWYANNNTFRFTDPDGRESDVPDRRQRQRERERRRNEPYTWGPIRPNLANLDVRRAAAQRDHRSILPRLLAYQAQSADGAQTYFAYLAQPITTQYSIEIFYKSALVAGKWRIISSWIPSHNRPNQDGSISGEYGQIVGFGETGGHTHLTNQSFSYADKANALGIYYVSRPDGEQFRYDPKLGEKGETMMATRLWYDQ